MPLYFFDTGDGTFQHRDHTGRELQDAEAARLVAIDILPDLARQALPDDDRRAVSVTVRDEKGERLYSASLTLRGRWATQRGALDDVVDLLIEAYSDANEEGDEKVAEMIRNMLTYLAEGLAERVGHKAAGIPLN